AELHVLSPFGSRGDDDAAFRQTVDFRLREAGFGQHFGIVLAHFGRLPRDAGPLMIAEFNRQRGQSDDLTVPATKARDVDIEQSTGREQMRIDEHVLRLSDRSPGYVGALTAGFNFWLGV